MIFKSLLKPNHKFGILLLFIALSSCGSDDSSPSTELTFSSDFLVNKVFDVGNSQNPSDIYFSARFVNTTINSVNVIIVKSTNIDLISEATLASLTASAYTSFNVVNSTMEGRLVAEQTDIDGNPLSLSTNYSLMIFNPTDLALSAPSESFELTEVAPLTGEYVGLWNDNLFTDIEVSARISSNTTDGTYTGDFFISTNLTPAWGGATDGSISFKVTNNSLGNFIYNQDLPNYMGGCPGTYTGDGVIEDVINLAINFAGDDCDGHHENGLITLKRIN